MSLPVTVIYDLDHTLLGCDSDYAWGQFLAESGAIDAAAYRLQNQVFYEDYVAGTLDPDAYLAFVLAPLTQIESDTLAALREQFLAEEVYPHVRVKAEELIATHRTAGHRQLIATSTNAFVSGPIAERFGIATLIAPEPEQIDGRYTGRVIGGHGFGPGKVARIEQWAARENIVWGETWGYSDSVNDIPLLSWVTRAVAVDPDEQLRAHAQSQGWEIISLA